MVHFCPFRTLQPLVTTYCLCIEKNMCQHILSCISQKEGHTGFKRHGGDDILFISLFHYIFSLKLRNYGVRSCIHFKCRSCKLKRLAEMHKTG